MSGEGGADEPSLPLFAEAVGIALDVDRRRVVQEPIEDRATSQRLARAVGARDRGCYRNALHALPRLNDATYVEGVVVIKNGLSLDHAWLEYAAGVVDPTPVYAAMAEGTCTYFAGPRWSLGEIHALFSSEQDEILTPILPFDVTDGPHREAWLAAKLSAFRHVSALHRRHTGQPAIARADDTATLEGLLGSYWAGQVLEGRASSANPMAAPTAPERISVGLHESESHRRRLTRDS